MSNDLQASVTSRIQGVTGPMSQVESGVNRVAAATKRLNTETKDYQKNATEALKKTGALTADAGKGVAGLAQALARLGGPVGALTGQIGGGAGMAGGLGRLAAAAGVAAFAMKALNAVSEANVERTRLAIAAQEEWTRAIEAGTKAQADLGKAGVGQAGGLRKAVSRGGAEAEALANRLAEEEGIDPGQAAQIAAQAFSIRDVGTRRRAVTASVLAGRTGEVDALAAITAIAGDRGLQQSVNGEGGIDRAAARVISKATGRRFGIDDLDASLDNVKASRFLAASDQIGRARGRAARTERDAAVDNAGVIAADILNATNPLAQAVLAQANATARQVESMDKLAAAQNGLAAALQVATSAQGNLGTQRDRFLNAQPPGTGPSPVTGQPFGPGG